MGKGKHNEPKKGKNGQQAQTPPRPSSTPAQPAKPVAVAPLPPKEPTPEQLQRLEEASMAVEVLSDQHGAAETAGLDEPRGATLEESLVRVEALLKSARSHDERARGREEATRSAEAAATTRQREAEAKLGAAREAAEAELAQKRQAQEQAELDLLQRVEAVDAREAAVRRREAACREREARTQERETRLAEREFNAEQGFLAEKLRVLKPVEDEVSRLRQERDRLIEEFGERRARAEEEAHQAAEERAKRWVQQEAERSAQEGRERRSFDEEMARERREQQAKLRAELKAEREQAEAAWKQRCEEQGAALEARAAELDRRQQALTEKAKELRSIELDLEASRELLAAEQAALQRKVDRLVAECTEQQRHEAESLRMQLQDAREGRDSYFKELESCREFERRLGDRPPEQLLADLAELERQRDDLARELRERPDARAAERLAELERERSAWLEERAALQGELARASGELATRRLAAIELEALRKQKEALEVHKQLLDGALDELRARVDELTRQDDHRNPMTALTSLDALGELQTEVRTTHHLGRTSSTLRGFAEDLRHQVAGAIDGRTLYYTERDLRSFLGGLAMTRLLLLQGISGTGKTSLPLAFAKAVLGGCEVVEVQAGWRDRQDLIGYYNAFHRHYYATNFLQALYRAGTPAYRDRLFLMVLDEINLSRPEQFFADFLSALEQPMADRKLTLVNDPVTDAPRLMVDGRHLPIPPNVWFVGTANHDETTSEFADKTYDRAHVMELPRKTEAAHFEVQDRPRRTPISFARLEKAFEDAAIRQEAEIEKAIVWLRKAPFAKSLGERFRVGWGNRLEHQLGRYLPVVVEAGGSVGEAMDHLLVTKVLRKLKDRHDVRAAALEELREQLLGHWGKLDPEHGPERCEALIENEISMKKGEELV